MEKTIKVLAALLGVQLAVAIGLGLTDGRLSSSIEPGPLVTLENEDIDRITLEGPGGEHVLLAKTGDGWQLPEEGPFPADGPRVKTLLERLQGLQAGLPVASSDDARERFKVSEETFERKIVLAKGEDALTTLYLGSSPGVRRIHARLAENDPIYTVELAAHDVPVDSGDWQDKLVLQFNKDEITSIQVADLTISRKTDLEGSEDKADTTWTATDLNADERLDQQAVNKLADLLSDLRIGEILGGEAREEYGVDEPILEVTVNRNSGDPIHYLLGKTPEKDEYTLKASIRPEYFRLPSFRATPLLDASKREVLIQQKEEPEEKERKEAAQAADATPGE